MFYIFNVCDIREGTNRRWPFFYTCNTRKQINKPTNAQLNKLINE